MKKKEHIIQQIVPGSIAEEMEIEPGDILLEINGHEIEDIFDYQYYCEDYEGFCYYRFCVNIVGNNRSYGIAKELI